jgi:glycolate oxidase FAD binding subunit
MHMTSPDGCLIDSVPLPVVRPASVAELGVLVRAAAHAEGGARPLYPLGGRTQLHVGLPPARPGLAVDLTGLDGVIDYPARDMTVTVQAGIRLAELARLLAGERQRLPIDVPQPELATLGGALATNPSGPRRYGFGTLRDYVIGISTVNDDGQETKAGGRVVKNVAGYDLAKLHIGALGTLGIISQVTLKVRPLPETSALLVIGCQPDGLEALLEQAHATRTRPACVEALSARAARSVSASSGVALPEAPWVVVVGFEDSEDAVSWQVQQFIKEVGSGERAGQPAGAGRGGPGIEARAGDTTGPLWQALTEHTTLPSARLSFKANLLPGGTAAFCLEADALPEEVLVQAHAGSGIVRGHVHGDLTRERAAEMLKGLGERAAAAGGNLVLPRCPTEWKHELPVWGAPRGDAWLMRQVRDRLCPHRLFNPGRLWKDEG